jgi:transcriptional regulator with XRE-family HTH domain
MAKKNHRLHFKGLPPAFRVEILKEIRDAKSISATEMSKRAGFPSYYVSRIETGETAFTGHAALQFAGEFLRDFREFKNNPKDDYLNIIKSVMAELHIKLWEELNETGIELDVDVMAGEAPPPWRSDPRSRRAQHAMTIIEENNDSARASKERSDQLIIQVELELLEFGMGLQGELGPVEFMTDERITLIRKRQRIQAMFEEIEQMGHRHELLPYIDVADRVDHSSGAILQDKFRELLLDFGDDAAIAALNEKVPENANKGGHAQMLELIEQDAAERKKVAGSRVTPAPPPVNDTRPNKRNLPVYG